MEVRISYLGKEEVVEIESPTEGEYEEFLIKLGEVESNKGNVNTGIEFYRYRRVLLLSKIKKAPFEVEVEAFKKLSVTITKKLYGALLEEMSPTADAKANFG